eukprot:766607-Hanusia_phi.AAC.5
MALPSYESVAPAASSSSSSSRSFRPLLVASAIFLAMIASVALLSPSDERKELLAGSPLNRLDGLALDFAKNGASMPVSSMLKKLDAWHDKPDTLLDIDSNKARTQMLSFSNGRGWMGSQLASDSQLCKKADIIISKFDQLLAKLLAEETQVNQTMAKVQQEYSDIKSTWLDSESKYRLTKQKEKEADEGAKYARREYDKWDTAHTQAVSDLTQTSTSNAAEKSGLESEKQLILEIMKMVGVVSNGLDSSSSSSSSASSASSASSSAASSSSAQSSGTASSNQQISMDSNLLQMSKKESLKQKINQLRNSVLAQKTVGKGRLQTLASSNLGSQSSEVAQILQEILDEIDTRLKNLDDVYNNENALVQTTNDKMVSWEKKLVSLSNAADKAKSSKLDQSLNRQKLSGKKNVAKQNFKEETAAYELQIQPYEKEIVVIREIKKKILDHCNGVSA